MRFWICSICAFEMPVGDKDVEPAVQIVIEKETAEAECEQAGPADSRTRRLVDKQAVAFVMIEGEHLIRRSS